MKKTIWKYVLPQNGSVIDIKMPIGARPLCVQMQNGQPCLWALVDPTAYQETRRFCVVGTGQEYPMLDFEKLAYVGTWQHGSLVWHLFSAF